MKGPLLPDMFCVFEWWHWNFASSTFLGCARAGNFIGRVDSQAELKMIEVKVIEWQAITILTLAEGSLNAVAKNMQVWSTLILL